MASNNKEYDIKDFELTLSTFLITSAVTLAGFKLYEIDKNNSNGEINIIKDYSKEETIDTGSSNVVEPKYTYAEIDPISDEYYRSIVIQGKTLSYENTPTPIPSPDYSKIDSYSDDMITGEDGVYPDGYFEYAERKEHSLNFKTVEEATIFYAKVFEIDETVALNVIGTVMDINSDNLTEKCYVNNKEYNSCELAISKILFDLYKHPDKYGYTKK